MSDAVIVGMISVVGSVIVQLIVSASKARESDAKMAAHEQQQKDQLDMILEEQKEIKKRLDQHNGYAEKFANSEKAITAVQKDVEYIKKDIGFLKGRVK